MQKKNNTTAIKRTTSAFIRGVAIGLLSLAISPAAYSFDFGPFKIKVGDDSQPAARPGGQASSSNRQQDITDAGVLAVSSPSDRPAVWPTSPHCRPLAFISKLDVDTAYAHAMRAFSFSTEEEVRRLESRTTVYRTDPIYKHIATRGSFYRMEQLVRYRGPNGEARTIQLAMALSKEGAGTAVEANYCTNPREAIEAEASYHDFVNKTIRNTF